MAILLKTASVRISSIQIIQVRVQNKGKSVWKSRYDGDVSGSDHIKPPDRKGPSNGDCLESGRRHMALVCKNLAKDTTLNEVLCDYSGRRPVKTCAEGLAYKGPSCSVVAAKSSMDFYQ